MDSWRTPQLTSPDCKCLLLPPDSRYNVKNPAGDYLQKESNVEVVRQLSQAKLKRKREEALLAKAANGENGENGSEDKDEKAMVVDQPEKPLSKILIIHPGSRSLRLGRASDFYPHEVPNCIARPEGTPGVSDPPAPGNRTGDESFDENIGHLREYLRNRLRQNKLTTDWKEGARVKATNSKAKPESIPEHNDPRRIEWTELEGREYMVGNDAIRLPSSKGWKVRYPIVQRRFNTRDWQSHQLLLDDFTRILQESLRTELNIEPLEYKVGFM